MASLGVLSSACRAMVSSTTPRLAPRWPPFSEMVLMISSRTSAATRRSESVSRVRRSSGSCSWSISRDGVSVMPRPPRTRTVPATDPKHPVDQDPASSEQKRLADSTASSMTTAEGTSGSHRSSYAARRSMARSSTPRRCRRPPFHVLAEQFVDLVAMLADAAHKPAVYSSGRGSSGAGERLLRRRARAGLAGRGRRRPDAARICARGHDRGRARRRRGRRR